MEEATVQERLIVVAASREIVLPERPDLDEPATAECLLANVSVLNRLDEGLDALEPPQEAKQRFDLRRRRTGAERQQIDDGVQTLEIAGVSRKPDHGPVSVVNAEQPSATIAQPAVDVGDGFGSRVRAKEPLTGARGPRQELALCR
jgi:hypothetical protein